MSITGRLKQFLIANSAKKGDSSVTITNTQIPSKEENVLGGRYSIEGDKYKEFLKLYSSDILNKGKNEYLTEAQYKEGGPIAIDLDLHYESNVRTRQCDRNHISHFISVLLEELKSIYQFDEDTPFTVYVMLKDGVTILEDKNLTKDGVHIIIGIKSDKVVELLLRERILPKMNDIFGKLPLVNSMEDVYDKSVSSGNAPWQLYGCKKPNSIGPYLLKHVYEVAFDEDDGELATEELDLNRFNITENIHCLSVRNKNNPEFFRRDEFCDEYNNYKQMLQGGGISNSNHAQLVVNPFMEQIRGDEQNALSRITNQNELDMIVKTFLETTCANEPTLNEAYVYTMALSESYYGNGSYERWIRVCWALKNTDPRLLIVWLAFSAKASGFSFSTMHELIERWNNASACQGLTIRSISYWLRTENSQLYNQLLNTEVITPLVKIIIYGRNNALEEKSNIPDDVLGQIMYILYKGEFVCAGLTNNTWYKFVNNRWVEDEKGISLRRKINMIGTHLDTYKNRIIAENSTERRIEVPEEHNNKLVNANKDITRRVAHVINNLGNTITKKNIMTEAQELFYDADFINSLDTNKHLIAFNNGVYDFKEKKFRQGIPNDYISLSTNIDYISIDKKIHQPIIDEIHDFMNKVYPDKVLRKYMWEHLACCMTGWNDQQTANFYLGIGAHGKSAILSLMSQVLGEYKYDCESSVITGGRARVGGVAPEIVGMKGKRLVVMNELSKTDILNEGVFKQLTAGNDNVQGRGLYQSKAVVFQPQLKLAITTNNLPKVNATDNGTWRRIRIVPHDAIFVDKGKLYKQFPKEDAPHQFEKVDEKDLNANFIRWKEVMASILIDIATETQGKVNDCQVVLSASDNYKESMDHIAEFIRDKIKRNPASSIVKADVATEFNFWYQSTYGRNGPSAMDLYDYLDKRFGRNIKGRWRGVELLHGNTMSDSEDEYNYGTDEESSENIENNDL
jgi:P4 family phage/plasmid primase-like protien